MSKVEVSQSNNISRYNVSSKDLHVLWDP